MTFLFFWQQNRPDCIEQLKIMWTMWIYLKNVWSDPYLQFYFYIWKKKKHTYFNKMMFPFCMFAGLMSGDATLTRQVKYSVVNQPNGSMVMIDGQFLPTSNRRYIAQQNGRRNELWLVWTLSCSKNDVIICHYTLM